MMIYGATYIVTALVFMGLDAAWLVTMSSRLYRPLLGHLLQDQMKPLPALAFYAIYIAGIVFFAAAPAFETGRWTTALMRGAALGFVAYATYDLTNMATLKNWPAIITWADLAWGSFATGMAAGLGYVVIATIFRLAKP